MDHGGGGGCKRYVRIGEKLMDSFEVKRRGILGVRPEILDRH